MRVRLAGLIDSLWRKMGVSQPRHVTPADVRLAYATAIAIDAAQFLLGPFGWAGLDEALDAIGMVVVSRLIGFHPLLLPTFVLEFIPLTDMLPTWTGCVALVVRARRRDGLVSDVATPSIDVTPTRVE